MAKYQLLVTQFEAWRDYERELIDYQQRCRELEDLLPEGSYLKHGTELTQAYFDRHHRYDLDYLNDVPDHPREYELEFTSLESAQETAFLLNLEGHKTRIFERLGFDDDGDEIWEQI